MKDADRGLLAFARVDEFISWAAIHSYRRVRTKGPCEVFRLQREGEPPIIFYARDSATRHLTVYGKGLSLVRLWIRARDNPA